jgi:hypothetical protein
MPDRSPNRRRELYELPPDYVRALTAHFGDGVGPAINQMFRRFEEAFEMRAGLRGPIETIKPVKMQTNRITGLAPAVKDSDAITFRQLLDASTCEFFARQLIESPEFDELIEDLAETVIGATLPWAWGYHLVTPHTSIAASPIGAANQITAWAFVVGQTTTISKVLYHVATAAAGKSLSIGLYDQNKDKVLDTGVQSAASTGVKQITVTTVTLEPAVYYLAYTSDGTPSLSCIRHDAPVGALMNTIRNLQGTDAGASVGAVLPATLGTLTSNGNDPPVVLVEE